MKKKGWYKNKNKYRKDERIERKNKRKKRSKSGFFV